MKEENEKLQQYVEHLNRRLAKGVSKAQNNEILVGMAYMLTNFIPQMVELKKSVFACTAEISDLKQEITELKSTNDALKKEVLSLEKDISQSTVISKNPVTALKSLDSVSKSNKRKGSVLNVSNASKAQKRANIVITDLPTEIWSKIFSYVSQKSKKAATVTCRHWWRIIRGDPKLSGHISVAWRRIKNKNWNWNNWPALKTLEITSQFNESTVALSAVKKAGFEKCANLQKVILEVDIDMVEISMSKRNFEKNVAKVTKIAFDPKLELDSFEIKHLSSLDINHIYDYSYPRSGFFKY